MVLADPGVRPGALPTPPASSLRRGAPRGGLATRTWLRLGLYGAALLAAFGGLSTVLEDVGWWVALAGTVAVPLLAIGVAAHLSRRVWVAPVVGLVVAVLLLTVVFAPLDSFLGLVPTGDTVAVWGQLIADGTTAIAVQIAPATARVGIQFLLALLALAAVVVVAPFLDRAPALAALPLLVVLDIPVAVRAGLAEPVWYVLTALLFLALLRVGRRRMPLPPVIATAALVVAGSLVVPSVLPAPGRVDAFGGGVGDGINPLIDLGDDLRSGAIVTTATYRTDSPTGVYLRLATLDDFDGVSWQPTGGVAADLADIPPPQGLADGVPRIEYAAEVEVGEVSGRWLPLPYPVTLIDGLAGDWAVDADGLTVSTPSGDVRGATYDVRFLALRPDAGLLNAAPAPVAPEGSLDLPYLPAVVRETAVEVAGSGTAYERALALQDYFAHGDFTYSLDAPVEEGYDGTGVGVIADFLEERAGYCVHFASSMAVMARVVGIPSRVVVGFQPGVRQSFGTRDVFTTTTEDLHAWPELYFEGVGWLRFEPTPGRGVEPDYSATEAVDDPATPEIEGPQATTAPVQPTAAPAETERPVETDPGVAVAANPWAPVIPVVVVIVLVLLLPALLRLALRARRLARVRAGDAAAAWAEVRDTAVDHDWVAPESETPRALGERLALVVGAPAVVPLRDGVESTAYDRPGRGALTARDVGDLRRAIARSAAVRVRVRAVLLPPSLLARAGIGRRPG